MLLQMQPKLHLIGNITVQCNTNEQPQSRALLLQKSFYKSITLHTLNICLLYWWFMSMRPWFSDTLTLTETLTPTV